MKVRDLLRLCRLIVVGVPLLVICLVGLLVAMADDLLQWEWLHRLDVWLVAWANELQEAL